MQQLAIRQHYATDGLVAAVMAVLVDRMWFDAQPLPPDAFRPLPSAWHAVWVGAFVGAVLLLMSGWWFGWVPISQLPPNIARW